MAMSARNTKSPKYPCSRTTSARWARNAFVIEMEYLLAQGEVFQQRGSTAARAEAVPSAISFRKAATRYRSAGTGRRIVQVKLREHRTPDFFLLPHWEFASMGRGILLWLLGVPIPIIILLALLWR